MGYVGLEEGFVLLRAGEDRQSDLLELGPAVRTFPWQVPELIARDTRLVELLQAGRFDFLMPKDEETRSWVAMILGAA